MPRRIEWISNTSSISGCLYISLCTSDAFPTALFEYVMRKNTEFLDSNSASTNPQMCLHLSKRGVNSECVGAMLELHLCAQKIHKNPNIFRLRKSRVKMGTAISEDAWLADCGSSIYIYILINIYFHCRGDSLRNLTLPLAEVLCLCRRLCPCPLAEHPGKVPWSCTKPEKHRGIRRRMWLWQTQKKVWQESNPWELKQLWSDAMKSLWATSSFYLSDQAFSVYSSKLWISQCVTNE